MTAPNRRELPIFELESEIVDALRANARLIVQALTGSGKSTQVPQILLDHQLLGDGQVVILQRGGFLWRRSGGSSSIVPLLWLVA